MACLKFQLVDKLNTNTEMEEVVNDCNMVSDFLGMDMCRYVLSRMYARMYSTYSVGC